MTNTDQTVTIKHEIVCITRSGFNFLHGERMDMAAKVTYQNYQAHNDGTSGCVLNPDTGVIQELFIPLLGWWG